MSPSMNAEMMMMSSEIGCVKPGACADLLLVDGDPLSDIALLAADGRHLSVILRNGELIKKSSN